MPSHFLGSVKNKEPNKKMAKNLNPSSNVEDETQKVAKALGVDLDEKEGGKEVKESDTSKKTDTEATKEDGRSGDSDKSKEDKVDYKEKYSESTKEFQTKYKPMEDSIKKLEQVTGKSLEDIISEATTEIANEDSEKGEDTKDTSKDGASAEVGEKISSIEEKLETLTEKFSVKEEQDKVSAKKIVDTFRESHEVSEEEYVDKIHPQLDGIKHMRKAGGDPYTLEEALDLAYVIANKDNIDAIVDKKVQQKRKELDLTFSPGGSKDSTSFEEPEFTDQQKDVAKRMQVDLEGNEDKK